MQCKPVVNRVAEGQRGDARYAKSAKRVSWQPNPAEVAEDELVSIARVGCVERSVVPSVEPCVRLRRSPCVQSGREGVTWRCLKQYTWLEEQRHLDAN